MIGPRPGGTRSHPSLRSHRIGAEKTEEDRLGYALGERAGLPVGDAPHDRRSATGLRNSSQTSARDRVTTGPWDHRIGDARGREGIQSPFSVAGRRSCGDRTRVGARPRLGLWGGDLGRCCRMPHALPARSPRPGETGGDEGERSTLGQDLPSAFAARARAHAPLRSARRCTDIARPVDHRTPRRGEDHAREQLYPRAQTAGALVSAR